MLVSSSRFCLASLVMLCAFGYCARVDAARFALFIGNNQGQGADAHLRFAESDTVRLAQLLTRLGGFASERTEILLGRTALELQRALAAVADQLRSTPGEHMVLVFYSGHADAQALHLGASVFSLVALREAVDALPAATRVMVLDACQAGVLTRPKGGRPGVGFEIDLGKGELTRGLAILAASSGSELAQESDQLRASVFTHYLEVGLSGLADRNRDGNVSLGEVFDYTSDQTLAATMGTTTGPQHPTFRLDLTGRDDLVLTRPGVVGSGYGRIRLDVPGWYFVRRPDGTVAAELVSRGDETLALEPGVYEVTRREADALAVASLNVGAGTEASMSQTASHPVAFGRMVRKGLGPTTAYGLAMATAFRSSVEGLGVSTGAAVVARADFRPASFELRIGLGRAQQSSAHLASTTWELSAAAAALRAFDPGVVRPGVSATFAFGAEVGLSHMAQTLDDGTRNGTSNPFLGPVALAELAVGRRFFLRADLGLRVYVLRVQAPDMTNANLWRPALWSALGGGTSF
jgi:Caspase domain